MKAGIPFLCGLAAAITGASIRSCEMARTSLLDSAWCGPVTHTVTLVANSAHQTHCAGCALLAAGVAAMAISLLFAAQARLATGAGASR